MTGLDGLPRMLCAMSKLVLTSSELSHLDTVRGDNEWVCEQYTDIANTGMTQSTM